MKTPAPPVEIGWREWVGLPDLGIDAIKAKVDTGARSSALHAVDVRYVKRSGTRIVKFNVHPVQKNQDRVVACEGVWLEDREVRSSNGKVSVRPVIETTLELGGHTWTMELTLTRRDAMGFRLLLGRQALRKRTIIHPGRSFLTGRRKP